MRYVVTGGAGFVGSHLVDRLMAEGNEVCVFDNLVTGRVRNVERHLGHPRFQFIEQDVTEYLSVDGEVSAVVHFASPASPIDYLNLPIQTLKVGSLGTHKALGLAKEKNAVFLLASTSEVYGDPLIHPQKEDYWGNVNPIGPRSVYDEAKRFAEAITMAYHRKHGVDTRIIRIFNTYGTRMRREDGRVVSNFIVQALAGKPLTVYGEGRQTRSFCYVSDLVEGILRLLRQNGDAVIDGKDIHYPVNLGNPTEFTIAELAMEVIRLTGSTSEIINLPLPEDDPKCRKPDITRAQALLNWQPGIGLKEGLGKTIDYFKQD
ncbi:MAG: UDP-glucuronic acid decarboxylase family protein [Acidobacteriota bacterium]